MLDRLSWTIETSWRMIGIQRQNKPKTYIIIIIYNYCYVCQKITNTVGAKPKVRKGNNILYTNKVEKYFFKH